VDLGALIGMGQAMASDNEVVLRPVVEFDHHSAEFAADFAGISNELRERCPVGFTEAHGGYWIASSYEAVATASKDTETFTVWKDIPLGSGRLGPIIPDHNPVRQGFAEMDGPEHWARRKPLVPFFSRAATEALRPEILSIITWVIDQFIDRGSVDIATELAGPIPAIATMRQLGLPLTDWRVFWDSHHEMFKLEPDPKGLSEMQTWLEEHLRGEALRRREQPRDDLISRVARMEIDGSLLAMDDVIGTLQLLLFGGVGTTAVLIANTLKYLGENPMDREWLREDLSRLPDACEEFLRCFPPIIGLARTVTRSCVLDGQALEKDDRVYLNWAAANRDPRTFEEPDTVKMDRFPNRHTTFALGAHRCIGSHVARLVWITAMEQVLTRLPDYQIDTKNCHRYESVGLFNGWESIPATFSPGSILGAELPG
jgi:cytochrome P450